MYIKQQQYSLSVTSHCTLKQNEIDAIWYDEKQESAGQLSVYVCRCTESPYDLSLS